MSMNGIQGIKPNLSNNNVTPNSRSREDISDSSFREALQVLQKPEVISGAEPSRLKFSNHAIERMQSRGVQFSQDQLMRIGQAIDKAAAKGSRNTLLITDQSALIVSVKDKTVVTVMDKSNMKENVFTNIDSTVMV